MPESKGFPSGVATVGVATVARAPEITFPVMVSGSEWTANREVHAKALIGTESLTSVSNRKA